MLAFSIKLLSSCATLNVYMCIFNLIQMALKETNIFCRSVICMAWAGYCENWVRMAKLYDQKKGELFREHVSEVSYTGPEKKKNVYFPRTRTGEKNISLQMFSLFKYKISIQMSKFHSHQVAELRRFSCCAAANWNLTIPCSSVGNINHVSCQIMYLWPQ